jgi:hypothetical protein
MSPRAWPKAQRLRLIVKSGDQFGKPRVLHQHQKTRLGLISGRRRIERRPSILEGENPVAGKERPCRKLDLVQGFWRQALDGITVQGRDMHGLKS